MICEACTRAATHPRTGIYTARCMGCEARMLAQSPQAHSREADPAAIQEAMRKAWPNVDDYKRGRSLVWDWIGKLEGVKA